MRKPNLSLALLLMAATLALTSCGRSPVAPQAALPSDPGTTSMAGTPIDDPSDPIVGEGGATAGLHVESQEAGVLKVGRWTLTVHKNSHIEAANISMTITDPAAMEVEIEVSPASANVFQVPIELTADCSDQPGMVIADNGIFWWNGDWELASDLTTQAGSMTIKAKATHLTNAKVSLKDQAVTTRGRN